MEAFRSFNRSGSGAVNIEEFVIGMVENLFTLYKNITVLGGIAEEVLAIENRSSELATRLEKETASSDKLVQFRSNLMSLLYLVRDKLRNPPKTASFAVNLSPDMLIRFVIVHHLLSWTNIMKLPILLPLVSFKSAFCRQCATLYRTSTSPTSASAVSLWSTRPSPSSRASRWALTGQVQLTN